MEIAYRDAMLLNSLSIDSTEVRLGYQHHFDAIELIQLLRTLHSLVFARAEQNHGHASFADVHKVIFIGMDHHCCP